MDPTAYMDTRGATSPQPNVLNTLHFTIFKRTYLCIAINRHFLDCACKHVESSVP